MSLATGSPINDLEAIRAALKEQPDGVLDDVARRHNVSLRVVRDILPGPASELRNCCIDGDGLRIASSRALSEI